MVLIRKILVITIALSLLFYFGAASSGVNYAMAASGPDLIVQNITLIPAEPATGETVTFTFTIKNQGTEEAGTSRISYYIDDNYITAENVNSIAAGSSTTTTLTWEAQAGTHIIKAVADSANQVAESDETNNTKTFTLSTLAPDLIIQSISWSPENPSRGDNIEFIVTIKNQGSVESTFCRLSFYINGSERGYKDVLSINPGSSVSKTYPWVADVGQHSIKAVIDEDNAVAESDETNNEQVVTFSTLPPDLIVEDVTWSPENPSENDEVVFTITVKNRVLVQPIPALSLMRLVAI